MPGARPWAVNLVVPGAVVCQWQDNRVPTEMAIRLWHCNQPRNARKKPKYIKKCHQTEKLGAVTPPSLAEEKGLKSPCKNLSLSFQRLQTAMSRGAGRALTPAEQGSHTGTQEVRLELLGTRGESQTAPFLM